MTVSALDRARHEFADRIIEYATANATVDLPDLLVDREVEMMIDELKVRTAQQGIRYEDYLRVTEKTEEALRGEYREAAEHRVKVLLVLGAVADREEVVIGDAEVEAEVGPPARRRGRQPRAWPTTSTPSAGAATSARSCAVRRSSSCSSTAGSRRTRSSPACSTSTRRRRARPPASLVDEVIGAGDEADDEELAAIEAAAAEEARA